MSDFLSQFGTVPGDLAMFGAAVSWAFCTWIKTQYSHNRRHNLLSWHDGGQIPSTSEKRLLLDLHVGEIKYG